MIYYDFHIHSALSPCGDADMTPNNIVNMAVISGLDAIAVSDHNSVKNVRAVMAAGKKAGIAVVPAMEAETEEEVHILTLYPTIDAAEEAAREVYKALPGIKNRPEIFGEQLIMDGNDEVTGVEEKLLITPAAMPMAKLLDVVRSVGGLFVPAHVDRHSYSVLTNLGFIPEDLDIGWIEISRNTADVQAYLSSRKDLAGYKILRNSDAHYLADISEKEACAGIESLGELFGRI